MAHLEAQIKLEVSDEQLTQAVETAMKNNPDYVAVVRCKDCVASRPLNRKDRFEAKYSDGCIYCTRTDDGVERNGYCSYGERNIRGNERSI